MVHISNPNYLGRLRQEDCGVEACLPNLGRPCLKGGGQLIGGGTLIDSIPNIVEENVCFWRTVSRNFLVMHIPTILHSVIIVRIPSMLNVQ